MSGAADLLDHVRAYTNPTQILTALLDLPQNSRPEPVPTHPPIAMTGSKQQLLNRIQTWTLTRDLARARNLARSLVRDLTRIRGLNRARVRALDLVRALVRARDLARICRLDLDLDRTVVRARALARALDRVRADDLDLSIDLASALDKAWALVAGLLKDTQVNVSGIDLTDVDLTQVDRSEALAGVVWDEATSWPPNVREWIKARSEQIEPGLYRVRRGTERDPHESASV
ncbi:hypothetical protein [Actinomadura macra]|uniref:hypothetical protein n=1 Tax=Actinomadura macra TaxID=46164 RepID=UPI0012FB0D22|nr:hypothetical protein [Actinomadura macra]